MGDANFDMCCGTTCDKAANQAYVKELEAQVRELQIALEGFRATHGACPRCGNLVMWANPCPACRT